MVSSGFIFSSIATTILSLLMGIFVVWKNRRLKLNQLWFAVSLSAAIWSFSLYKIVSAKSESEAITWNWFLYFGAIFIPIFYYHFTLILVDKVSQYKKYLTAGYIVSFLFLISVPTKLFVKGAPPMAGFDYWLEVGPIYYAFVSVFLFLVGWSLLLLIKGLSQNVDPKKQQIKYILFAGIIGFTGGITDFFPQLMNIYPIGNYFVMLYVIIVTYAILQYNLMNIKIIATQILSVFLVVLMAIEVVKAQSWQEMFYQFVIFIAVFLFAILLVRSVNKEVKQREKLELLSLQLEKANEHLKELMKMKSEFLAIASHQLRTPLTAIRGLLGMQADGDFDSYPKEKLDQVHQDMFTCANRLNNIVNDLLDALEVEGGLKLTLKPTQLEPMIEAAIKDLQPNYDKKGLYLKFEKPASPLPKIDGEERYLSQIFMNLIDNAEKYTPTGGVTITAQASGNSVVIRVKDTGIGIKPEDQKKLFEKFTRAEMGARTHAGGSGLGLFIVKRIVAEHQGKIKIESAGVAGQGTTFVVTLPLKQGSK